MSEYILEMLKQAASTIHNHKRGVKTIEPRIVTKRRAAEYCGLSTSGYQAWVDEGFVPGPLPGTKRYDRLAIDRAIDKLSGIGGVSDPESEYEAWKAMS